MITSEQINKLFNKYARAQSAERSVGEYDMYRWVPAMGPTDFERAIREVLGPPKDQPAVKRLVLDDAYDRLEEKHQALKEKYTKLKQQYKACKEQ